MGICQGHGACHCTHTIPAEAGNVHFPDPELDDIVDAWPVTGRQIAAFWALLVVAILCIITVVFFGAVYAVGLGNADVGQIIMTGGL